MDWYSVKNKLPKPYVSVLCYMPDQAPFPTVREGYYKEQDDWYIFNITCYSKVTHWAYMPEFKIEA